MEKGNGEAAGPPVAEAESGDAGTSSGTPDRAGGSQADQTRERDPWAGTPDIGETTLPDGTKLRRDADGNMYRGPDAQGHEHVWDPEQGWLDAGTRERGGAPDGWGNPDTDWHDAWGGSPMPDSWRDVPRSGSTQIPEGELSRDGDGKYRLKGSGGEYVWNESTGQWYHGATGHEVPPGLGPADPANDWINGTKTDAYMDAHPELGHSERPSWRGSVQP